MFRVPLLAVRVCPVCGRQGVYDPRELGAPAGWIHVMAFGVDERVCSQDCVGQVYKHQAARKKALDESRKEPLLPPDVVI